MCRVVRILFSLWVYFCLCFTPLACNAAHLYAPQWMKESADGSNSFPSTLTATFAAVFILLAIVNTVNLVTAVESKGKE